MRAVPSSIRPPNHAGRRGRIATVAIELFVGVGAVYGGVRLLLDAEGFGVRRAWLHGTPFSDYTVPGLVLLVVIGGGMLTAAVLMLLGHAAALRAALLAGIACLVFIATETALIGYRGPPQLVLLVAVGVPAAVLVRIGARSRAGGD